MVGISNPMNKLDELMDASLRLCIAISGADRAYVLMGDRQEYSFGLDSDGAHCSPRQVIAVIVEKAKKERVPIFKPEKGVACFPLIAGIEMKGLLYLRTHEIPDEETSWRIELLAAQMAFGIESVLQLEGADRRIAGLETALGAFESTQSRMVDDPLTGLFSYAYFQEQLAKIFYQHNRYGTPLSLIVMDLDNLQEINETYGRTVGDDALRRVSATIKDKVRDCDIAARYGGDEIVVILPETEQNGASILAERLREAISQIDLEGGARVTVSLGVIEVRQGGGSVKSILERLIRTLYLAKHGGGNRVARFGEEGEFDVTRAKNDVSSQGEARFYTIQALVGAVGARDSYTLTHSENLARYAKAIGVELNLPAGQLEELEMSGILHDVGKIAIPDLILNKPSALTEEERAIIQSHPEEGSRILRAGNLGILSGNILYHHERWDGNGYPDGLKGEEIPINARILAVVDAYDAMVSDRPYRKGRSQGEAFEELRRCMGKQFDPEVVEVFISMLEEKSL
ncbi:MAG TPA: HD domain-containing phosphohydrolase [Chroococcales cyanobacterium]